MDASVRCWRRLITQNKSTVLEGPTASIVLAVSKLLVGYRASHLGLGRDLLHTFQDQTVTQSLV